MQVRTQIKAGMAIAVNHNETLVRAQGQASGLKVKTRLRAGMAIAANHNETLVRATPRQRSRG